MDINRQQSVGLIIIRPKNPQSDRKSDRLKIFRPECVKILKRSPAFWRPFLVFKQSKRFGLIKLLTIASQGKLAKHSQMLKKRPKYEDFHNKSL